MKTIIINYKYINENSDTYPKSVVCLNNKAIENVKIFRYSDDDVKYNQPPAGDAEVNLRIAVAEAKFYQLATS